MERKYVNSNVIVKTLMVIVDYISVICGIVSAYNLRLLLPFSENDMALHIDHWYAYIITPLVFISVLFLNHGYKIDTAYWEKDKKYIPQYYYWYRIVYRFNVRRSYFK